MPLEPITYQDFEKIKKKDPYFNGRWSYHAEAVRMVKHVKPETVLEAGGNGVHIFKGSDDIDINKMIEPVICHDLREVPWPVTKHYDLFIALQVWEHLEGEQQKAFLEVMRISDRALLSFPYKWINEGPRHSNNDMDVIRFWTLGVDPKAYVIHEPHGRLAMLIMYFEFDTESIKKARKRAGLF